MTVTIQLEPFLDGTDLARVIDDTGDCVGESLVCTCDDCHCDSPQWLWGVGVSPAELNAARFAGQEPHA